MLRVCISLFVLAAVMLVYVAAVAVFAAVFLVGTIGYLFALLTGLAVLALSFAPIVAAAIYLCSIVAGTWKKKIGIE